MTFQKVNKLSKGRPAGAVNRSTEQMKLSIARATNSVLDDLPKMLEEMKKKDPRSAIDLVIKLLEYNLPKQSRVEMRAEIDQRIHQISVNINKSGSDGDNH
jgi:hypothetical protein